MYLSCPPALHNIFHTPVARYSLFVLKVALNTNQLTNILLSHLADLLCAQSSSSSYSQGW